MRIRGSVVFTLSLHGGRYGQAVQMMKRPSSRRAHQIKRSRRDRTSLTMPTMIRVNHWMHIEVRNQGRSIPLQGSRSH